MKPVIYFTGSSHGKRLYSAFLNLPVLTENCELKNYAKSGCKYENLVLPNLDTLTANDYLIIQVFGNNLLEKHIRVKYIDGKKQFMLTRYKEVPENYILKIYSELLQRLKNCKGTLIILDSPPRHLNHTPRKIAIKVLKLFQARNKLLHDVFKNSGIHTIDHRKFIGFKNRTTRTVSGFSQHLCDNVHLTPEAYREIANNIFEKFILPHNPQWSCPPTGEVPDAE
jgi:lysophospholipase L1-like esterase